MPSELSVEKVKKGFDLKKASAVIVVLFVVSLGGSVYALESQIVEREKDFNISATVEPEENGNNTTLGVNTGQGLHYGNLTYDTNFTKFVEVGVERKSILEIQAQGNVSQITYFDNRQYFRGMKEVKITAGSDDLGRYEGSLEMVFQVPKSRWGAKWLDIKYKYF